ncbi:hypothetical protein Tco_1403337 [Tanacetum coccineum]
MVLEIWFLRSGNGGVSVVVRGGEWWLKWWLVEGKSMAHFLKKCGVLCFFNAEMKCGVLDVEMIEQGNVDSDIMSRRSHVMKDLQDLEAKEKMELAQKAKIKWSIEGDENSKYFHGILNKKQNQLVIQEILVDGDWIDDPVKVKK